MGGHELVSCTQVCELIILKQARVQYLYERVGTTPQVHYNTTCKVRYRALNLFEKTKNAKTEMDAEYKSKTHLEKVFLYFFKSIQTSSVPNKL
jgi:hypothetical protein